MVPSPTRKGSALFNGSSNTTNNNIETNAHVGRCTIVESSATAAATTATATTTSKRKSTGTVPKTTATAASALPLTVVATKAATMPVEKVKFQVAAVMQQQIPILHAAIDNLEDKMTLNEGAGMGPTAVGQQQQQQHVFTFPYNHNRSSPSLLNTVVAIQQHQQQQQQHHPPPRKNTEIVAPIRREFKDLNEYLLSTVVSTAPPATSTCETDINGLNAAGFPEGLRHKLKLQNNRGHHQHSTNNQSAKNSKFNQPAQGTTTNSPSQEVHYTQGNANVETETENLRFCYPVRPIPRRTHQQQQQPHHYRQPQQQSQQTNAHLLNHAAATIGVVIPTTPNLSACVNDSGDSGSGTATPSLAGNLITTANSANEQIRKQALVSHWQQLLTQPEQPEEAINLIHQPQQRHQPSNHRQLPLQPTEGAVEITVGATGGNTVAGNLNDSALLQRLQLIQQLLNLSGSAKPKVNQTQQRTTTVVRGRAALTTTTNTTSTKATALVAIDRNNPQQSGHQMVNEPQQTNNMENDMLVNSTSLESVSLAESTDRAQSIQSLHSVIETPSTPETTPTYDELQMRLETSNRNIQNMQEQQQQLLRLQNAAKQHLVEMEELRQHTGNLSFGPHRQNGAGEPTDTPDYESIEQVHSDMASLVGRMKNLTQFIHNQNELTNLLGEDGPEILAEQEALQQKLESLRAQREDMKSLVDELQSINREAEQNQGGVLNRQDTESESPSEEREITPVRSAVNPERNVPIEYSRVVPIELLTTPGRPTSNHQTNGCLIADLDPEEDMDAATEELIRQKTADVETMKAQLKRLKDMMETVTLIENNTGREVKDIGRAAPREPTSRNMGYDRDRTPVAVLAALDGGEPNDRDAVDNAESGFIIRKKRMIDEVTSDLRTQAANLQAERERIKRLKEEIVRRKEQAAAAAQLGEDALQRHSLTPTPISRPREEFDESSQAEREQLKSEYAAKKKEFELLCRRLQDTETAAGDSAADDEAVDEERKFTTASAVAAAADNKKFYSGKESLDSTMNSSHAAANAVGGAVVHAQDGVSLEAASVQSGSSRSYSIPPTGGLGVWPVAVPPAVGSSLWKPHFMYGAGGAGLGSCTPPQCGALLNLTAPNMAAATTVTGGNDCLCSAGTTAAAATAGSASAATSAGPAASMAQFGADPIMLQQFVQTQQMLINSVCQCNQMLWHQQREIDGLNSTIRVLQDRLLAFSVPSADLAFNVRSESVPPPSLSGPAALQANSLFLTAGRAYSEQPNTFLPNGLASGGGGGGVAPHNTYNGFQQQQQFQQQQLMQQQQQHVYHQRQRGMMPNSPGSGGAAAAGGGGYNYSAETQQMQNTSSTSTSIYSSLNNAAQPPPPTQQPSQQQTQQFNNEAPHSPLAAGSTAGVPGPIFMHHHNNAIHQNNSNLRTQNHYANNVQHQQHNNIGGGGAGGTLNNQVPPGNRANNYWDNFRSYSRQNLLSTNAASKSNEEQQLEGGLPLTGASNGRRMNVPQHRQLRQADEATLGPPPPPHLHLYHLATAEVNSGGAAPAAAPSTTTAACNNLNYVGGGGVQLRHSNISNIDVHGGGGGGGGAVNDEFLRSLQRSRINHLQQQQQRNEQQPPPPPPPFHRPPASNLYHNGTNIEQQQQQQQQQHPLNWPTAEDGGGGVGGGNEDHLLYASPPYNLLHSTDGGMSAVDPLAASFTSNLRNMNVNFGNSPHYQRNKVPAKQTYRCETTLLERHFTPPQLMQSLSEPGLDYSNRMSAAGSQQQQQPIYASREGPTYPSRQAPPLPPPPTSSSSSSQKRFRSARYNRDAREYLLRPVNNGDGRLTAAPCAPSSEPAAAPLGGGVGAFGSYNIPPPLLLRSSMPLMDGSSYKLVGGGGGEGEESAMALEPVADEVAADADEEEVDDEEEDGEEEGDDDDEDDTTSEEIKRNLLVNAFKNEKFTTKFYESIKEDVFRRLESLLLDTSDSDPPREQRQQPHHATDSVAHEAVPKMSVEGEFRQRHSLLLQPMEPMPLLDPDAEEHDDQEEEAEDNTNAETESNKADNEESSPQHTENDRPEDDDNETLVVPQPQPQQPSLPQATAASANVDSGYNGVLANTIPPATPEWRQNLGDCVKKMSQLTTPTTGGEETNHRVTKKRKNRRVEQTAQPPAAAALVVDSTASVTRPDYELIGHIIGRLRQQMHAHTLINDTLLVEVAKLTVSSAQRFAAAKQSASAGGGAAIALPHIISPKKIYTRIKKLAVSRQRDEFLLWYQDYLETLLLTDQPTAAEAMRNSEQHLNPPFSAAQQHEAANDTDLAEADQTCSPNPTTTTTNSTRANSDGEINNDSSNSNGDVIVIKLKLDSDEFENNENPDEAVDRTTTTTTAPDDGTGVMVSSEKSPEDGGTSSASGSAHSKAT